MKGRARWVSHAGLTGEKNAVNHPEKKTVAGM